MKYFRWLLCMLLSAGLQAQVAKLEAFAKGAFYSSATIKDDNNNVRGYFLLFENDKLGKETFRLEYVLLDENLTKVTDGFITEDKYDRLSLSAKNVGVRCTLHGTKLLLEIFDNFEYVEVYKRYRLLDIKTFEITEPFISKNGKIIYNPKFERRQAEQFEGMTDDVVILKGVGIAAYSPFIKKDSGERRKYITHYDDNLQTVWEYVYDDDIQGKEKYIDQKFAKVIGSDAGVIVLLVHGTRSGTNIKPEYAIHFIEASSGKLLKAVMFPETGQIGYEVTKCMFQDDKICLAGLYQPGQQWLAHKIGFLHEGMFRHTYDRNTMELIEKKQVPWKESIGGRLTLDKRNAIKDEGYLYAHDLLPLTDGSMIGVFEAYTPGPFATKSMYFFEFAPDFTIKNVYEATKFGNKFPEAYSQSTEPVKYGLLDFVDYQAMGDDEFAFLFLDNEKDTRNRKHTTLYGVVVFSDGKFSRQTINRKTGSSTIYIENAKKGYLLLQEDFDDKNKRGEMRLEKINY